MEDLWKVTRIDYRISAIAERKAYEEIVSRYRTEETGAEKNPLTNGTDQTEMLIKE